MEFEVVDPSEVDGPIHQVPEVWDDEKPHMLEPDCWCEPHIEGQYVGHRSVFDDR